MTRAFIFLFKKVEKYHSPSEPEIMMALGLDKVKNPIPARVIEMYDGDNKKMLPVNFNSHFRNWTRRERILTFPAYLVLLLKHPTQCF